MDKLLLDTTYLLPLLGIGIELENYQEVFPKLHVFYEIYYSPLSLIEAKWIVIRTVKRIKNKSKRQKLLEEYRIGLDLLLKSSIYRKTVLTNGLIERIADDLWINGVKDYFDRMIYATAAYYGAILLTEDEELKNIYDEIESMLKPKEVINWNTLVSRIKTSQH